MVCVASFCLLPENHCPNVIIKIKKGVFYTMKGAYKCFLNLAGA